jgi:hypothetical protein
MKLTTHLFVVAKLRKRDLPLHRRGVVPSFGYVRGGAKINVGPLLDDVQDVSCLL